jgi:uncharacterized protein (DUF1501 family)
MNRRNFLCATGASVAAWSLPHAALANVNNARNYRKLLVLVELKGANDGLNTVVPFRSEAYRALRPQIGLKAEQVLPISDELGLHNALEPLMPLWKNNELAVINGIGYEQPNFSHFRSIEIWDTASKSDEYKSEGWLTRAFAQKPTPINFAADGILVGSSDLGPLTGGARAIALQSIDAYLRQAKLADAKGQAHNKSLAHVLKIESDVMKSAKEIAPQVTLKTEFPNHGFGGAIKTAMHVVAGSPGVAVVRVTLGGFDTHINQTGTHQNLLKQLAEGLSALRAGLMETNRWNDALVMTYCEFGRRARENQSQGTDHGTANVQFAMGGAVKGGLYGALPSLTELTDNGNLKHTVDYRSYYASALAHWGVSAGEAASILGGNHTPLPFLRV